MAAQHSGLASARSIACSMPVATAGLTALRASGRWMVMIATLLVTT